MHEESSQDSSHQDRTLTQSDDRRKEMLRRLAAPGAWTPPARVPGYELIRPLGRGSFGEVWLALAANTRREVAVKIFTRERGVDWDLLHSEVEKMASVATERRIVQLLEVGWEGERPYFVMEYLPGGSLAETLDRGRVQPDQALELCRQVAEALVYLHSKAILHCDLKPANVLLDGRGGIRLGDLGQARARNERGSVAGTLFYMAPEQAVPGAQPDVRSDLYSLGAILFALITGRPPHATEKNSRELAGSSSVTDRLEKYRRLLLTSPSPLDSPDLAGLDRPLLDILKGCLSADPAGRFRNAQQVLNAVARRTQRRQQKPLLIFSLVAPLLLWAGLAGLGYGALEAGMSSAREALEQQSLASHLATAQMAAAAVDYHLSAVERRVSREAADPELARRIASGAPLPELQAYSDRLYETYKARQFFSWVISDHRATALARSPFDERVVGSSYAYREWFSGRVESTQGDLPIDVEPRQDVGLTQAFRSTAEGSPLLVSVAAPVRAEESNTTVGVLAAMVQLETFQEWLEGAERADAGGCPERLVLLLDRGQLVRHPCPGGGAESRLPMATYGESDGVRRLLEAAETGGSAAMVSESFIDPLRPGQIYLAAASRLQRHPDWLCLVLQERPRALAPLGTLDGNVRDLAMLGTGVGLVMLLALYFLLFRLIRRV